MPPARRRVRPGEQAAQQRCLRRGRVLVLVQQHNGEFRTQRGGDGGHLGRQPGGRGHLVGELDVAQFCLQLLVANHQRRQLQALCGSGPRQLQGGVHLPARVAGGGGELGVEGLRLVGQRERVNEVGTQLTGELQEALRYGGRP